MSRRRVITLASRRALSMTPFPVMVLVLDPADKPSLGRSSTSTIFFFRGVLTYFMPPIFGSGGTVEAATCLDRWFKLSLFKPSKAAWSLAVSSSICFSLSVWSFSYRSYQFGGLPGSRVIFSQPVTSLLMNSIQSSLSWPSICGDAISISLCAVVSIKVDGPIESVVLPIGRPCQS